MRSAISTKWCGSFVRARREKKPFRSYGPKRFASPSLRRRTVLRHSCRESTRAGPTAFIPAKCAQERTLRLTQVQAEAIGRLQLIQLVGLELEKLVEELKQVADRIAEYQHILGNDGALLDIIREDTYELKEKYGDNRRTEITGNVSAFNMESLIAQEDVVVTVSHEGYIKRLPMDTYRSQGRGGRGIKGTESKEGDFVEHLFVANTHDYLLFFTNQGRVYERRVYDVPEMSAPARGGLSPICWSFNPAKKSPMSWP